MGIAKSTDYWVSRLSGNDPTNPNGKNNTAWTKTGGSGGSVSGNAWRITNGFYKYSTTNTEMTLMCAIGINTAPSVNENLMVLDNGTHRVELVYDSTNKVRIIGAGSATSPELDLTMTEENPVPCLLRLTLAEDGTARLYMLEIIDDDDAQQHYLSITGKTSTEQGAFFGNTTGSIDWYAVYFTDFGSFSPDEMNMSDFTTNSLMRTGLAVVQTLKESNRYYLKNHVGEGAIVYGYDLSSKAMVSRVHPPSIHVITQRLESPDFLTLAGSRTDQRYNIVLYITTRGTDYKNAYRLGLSIMGEAFDELYTQTGLQDGVDSIISYSAQLDSKMDDDEVICIHALTITYMKKIRMFFREV